MAEVKPLLDKRPLLLRYYDLAESRLGYRFILNDARHFAFYDSESEWPWPIDVGLRRMELEIFKKLQVRPGDRVLDCGCGYGLVALFMARQGLVVDAIDFVQRHVTRASARVKAAGLSEMITVRQADYHHLEDLPAASFNGVYTSETLVHAVDPVAALRGWHRLLKPGGKLVLSEYSWKDPEDPAHPHRRRRKERVDTINRWADMPSFVAVGNMPSWVREAGFTDVQVVDITRNVVPMMWLFWALAYIPYVFVKLFRLEPSFPNAVAAVEMYEGKNDWEFFHIVATRGASN